MHRFWDIAIAPVLDAVDAAFVVEVGSAQGRGTRLLADWAAPRGTRVRAIDPAPRFDPATVEDPEGRVRVDRRISLDALPGYGPVDVALVDGDHNYYTVRGELEILLGTADEAGTAGPVALCHDVGWPYARRDLYYDPGTIPELHQHPWARRGIVRGRTELAERGGLNTQLCNAIHEGGPRNGVLTAVEDVVRDHGGLHLTVLPVLYGLAAVIPKRRLDEHPALRAWCERWTTAEGWAALTAFAEEYRTRADAAVQARADRVPVGVLDEVRGRSFRPALPSAAIDRIQKGVLRTRYRGMRFLKNPFDVVLYQELIGRLRPGTVIEVGTDDGGSAAWFADVLQVHGGGQVVTIDRSPRALSDPRIRALQGDANELGATLTPQELAGMPRPWLVVEDSAHTYEATLAVLRFFDDHLVPGDYVVVEDGILADLGPDYVRWEDGPNRAVARFLTEHPTEYVIDDALCDRYGHNVTWAPNAWLRRR